jgi:hypothetical protein
MNAELEKWMAVKSVYADRVYEHAGMQSIKRYIAVDDLRALFDGKVLVPVEIAPAIARAVDLLGRHGDAFADLGAMTILQDFLAASQEQPRTMNGDMPKVLVYEKTLQAERVRELEEALKLADAAPELLEFAKEWLAAQGDDNNHMTAKARAAIAKAEDQSCKS